MTSPPASHATFRLCVLRPHLLRGNARRGLAGEGGKVRKQKLTNKQKRRLARKAEKKAQNPGAPVRCN